MSAQPESVDGRQQHLSHVAYLEVVLVNEGSRRDIGSTARRARVGGLDAAMRIDTWDESAAVRYRTNDKEDR